jgi:hypothetical protein
MSISPKPKKGKILYFSALSILGVFLGGALNLYGQGVKTWMGNNLEQQINAAGLKFGPFKIRTVLNLTNAGYNSNVYRTPINPIEDFALTIGPGFYVYLPIKKKIVISIYESPQYVYFMETERQRGWNNYFNGQVHFILNRFFITLGKGYVVARETWNTEIDVQPLRKEDSYHGSLLWQISKKTSLFFRFSQAKYDYEDLSFGDLRLKYDLNRTQDLASITAYYRLSFRTMFFLNLEHSYFDFQYPLNPRDSQSYAIYSGIEFLPLGIFGGRLNLGYEYFDALAAGITDSQGIVGDTALSIRLARPLTIRINYRRDVQFSAWYNNAYYSENIVGGGASLYLSKNIRLDYNFSYGRNNYPATISEQSDTQKRQDNYTKQSAGLYFRIKKNIGLGVTATYWQRDSNLDWQDGKQTLIGINLIQDFK